MEDYLDEYNDVASDPLDNPDDFAEADEAEEDNTLDPDGEPIITAPDPKPVKVKRPVLNPQPKLNFQTLQGPKGILALNDMFKDFKFRGDGFEKEDLANVLNKLEHWAFRLFPKFHFEDSLKRLESLGKKREVQVYLRKIRQGLIDNDDVIRQVDDDDNDDNNDGNFDMTTPVAMQHDEFDDLLSQQISQTIDSSQLAASISLSEEQSLRIERNKQLALERKRMKEQALTETSETVVQDETMDSATGVVE